MRGGNSRPISRVLLLVSGLVLITGLAMLTGREAVLMRNTLWLAGGSWLMAWPTGSLLAVSATRLDRRGQFLFWCGIAFLAFLPLHVQAAAWDLRPWLLEPSDTAWGEAWWAALAGYGIAAIPWVTLLTAWQLQVPASVADALCLDATAAQSLWHGMLPRLLASLPITMWWVLIQTSTDITLTDLYQVRTYAEEVYVGFSMGDGVTDLIPQTAAWHGVAPALVAVGLMVASCCVLQRMNGIVSDDDCEPESVMPRWGETAILRSIRGLAAALLLLLVVVPLASLMHRAGMEVMQIGSERVRQWSVAKLATLTGRAPWDFLTEIGWTVLLGQMAAIGGLVVAGAWSVIARHSLVARWMLCLVVACSLVIPGPVVGLALDGWGSRPSLGGAWIYDRTFVFPVVALWWHILPWQVAIVWAGVRSLPADQLDEARIQGTTPWRLWTRIAAPQRGTCLITAWLVGFLLASSDLSTSMLVMPPGISTLSVRVFGLLHAAADDRVAALCLFTSGSVAVASLAVVGIWHRFRQSLRYPRPASYNTNA